MEWLTVGYIESHTGPNAGPSSEHRYAVRCVRPDSGPITYPNVRLANVRWADAWDTLPVPIGAACLVWRTFAGDIYAGVFGLAEQLLPCGEQPGAGSLVPGETGEVRQPVPPPPSGGFTQTSVSAPDGGGEGGVG